MRIIFALLCGAALLSGRALAQTEYTVDAAPTKPRVPFEGMDHTWINGKNHQTSFPLAIKDPSSLTFKDVALFTAYVDAYFNYNMANPQDNTQTISSSMGRHKEFTLNLASFGVETNYKNVIGRLWLQTGNMLHIVQELDGSVLRGRNTSTNNLKYIREAAAGYHFNKWYGINVEGGIFMSYIGLESYILQENWSYQRSMVCDFTPFYFSGARIQMYPTKNYKTELWLMNGWQSYNSWNSAPAIGSSNYYHPNENIQLVANFYLGQDTRGSSRMRFHHDNSVVFRYLKRLESKGLAQAAFSINTHYGFQSGDGATIKDQYMTGTSIANRLWFMKKKIALTVRGDVITNPGLYLAFSPSPVTPNDFTDAFSDPNKKLLMGQGTITFDVMPNDYLTFRLEYGVRTANAPYFPGPGGTTSPDGFSDTPTGGWRPDLRSNENRFTVACQFRM